MKFRNSKTSGKQQVSRIKNYLLGRADRINHFSSKFYFKPDKFSYYKGTWFLKFFFTDALLQKEIPY